MSEDSVQLKIQDMQFECTFCKNTNFIKKVLSIKADGDNSFGFGKSTERVQAAVCTKCGYIHMFMPKETDAFKEAFEKEIKGIK
jgi:DNA-directed RNA polymerase subunit RPC12/RpoP